MYAHAQLWLASLVGDFHLDSLLLCDTLSYSSSSPASSLHTRIHTHTKMQPSLRTVSPHFGSVIFTFWSLSFFFFFSEQAHVWNINPTIRWDCCPAAAHAGSRIHDERQSEKLIYMFRRERVTMISGISSLTDARFHFFFFPVHPLGWVWPERTSERRTRCTLKAWKGEKHALCFCVLQQESARHTNCSSPRCILFIATLLSCTSAQTIICDPVGAWTPKATHRLEMQL